MSRLVLSFFLLLPFCVSAATPQVMWFFGDPVNGGESGPHASVASACGVLMGIISRNNITAKLEASEQTTSTTGRCKYKNYSNGNAISDFNYYPVAGRASCPDGKPPGSGGQCTDPAPSQCAANSGKDTTINWTSGYTRSPDIDADASWKYVGAETKPPADGVICDPVSSCQMALVLAPSMSWQSRSPTTQGLYRVSYDYPAQHLGKSCTPSATDTAGASPNAPQPTCPGAVGEVNGVVGCYGTASNPTRNDTPVNKPKQPSAANPAAGQKPTSGSGSGNDGPGRTPTNGDGGPAGGPAGAAGGTGTKPDGTTPKPGEGKEQANCGAPGQPKCGIDETGTPDGKSAFDKAKADMEAEGKRQLDGLEAIKRTDDKNTSWGVIPSWIAHGECSPWNLGTLPLGGGIPIEIDICSIVPYVNAVSNFLWAVFTFFATISMVFRVTTATKD